MRENERERGKTAEKERRSAFHAALVGCAFQCGSVCKGARCRAAVTSASERERRREGERKGRDKRRGESALGRVCKRMTLFRRERTPNERKKERERERKREKERERERMCNSTMRGGGRTRERGRKKRKGRKRKRERTCSASFAAIKALIAADVCSHRRSGSSSRGGRGGRP